MDNLVICIKMIAQVVQIDQSLFAEPFVTTDTNATLVLVYFDAIETIKLVKIYIIYQYSNNY